MKIKPYKLTKRNIKVNPFIILPTPIPKPKIPFRLLTKVHKPNFYDAPQFIVEVVPGLDLSEPLPVPLLVLPLVEQELAEQEPV